MRSVEKRASTALEVLGGKFLSENKSRRLARILGIELEKLFQDDDFEAIALVLRTLALRMTGRFK